MILFSPIVFLRARFALAALAVISGDCPAAASSASPYETPATLLVAVVQMRSERDLAANIAKIRARLAECARRGVQVVAFPECAVSTYYGEFVRTLEGPALAAAEAEIAEACRAHRINAIIGTATVREGRFFNTALFIDDRGRIVARHDKLQLVGGDRAWDCQPGGALPPVVRLAGVPCTVIICHDSRYPELCRLPVLAGARVVFYISHESPLAEERKLDPYRAQVQARAVENQVFLVHANAPADDLQSGSHGQSRMVGPDGNVLQEAGFATEELLVAELDLREATAGNARRSLERGPLREWWREAVTRVPVVP